MKPRHVMSLLALLVAFWPAPKALADEPTIDVIVLADSDAAPRTLAVRELGGEVVKRFKRVPVSVVRVPADQLKALQSLPGVRAVEKDFSFSIDDLKPADPRFATTHTYDLTAHGLQLTAVDVPGSGLGPAQYLNYLYTGAAGVWAETGAGAGSIVAVIDTGVHPVEPCLSTGQVLAPGFDVWGDNPATAPDNAPHGTWVGNVIASVCKVVGPPADPLLKAVATHAPGILYDVPPGLKGFDIVGIAPGAKIYPVKAFLKDGNTTWAKILEAMDHVIDVKLSGTLDIDVVNLSLGKTALFDGREITDRFIDEMRRAGILVVCAAANEGPVPSTIATPGTSFSSLTAGGTDEAVSSRIFYEWYGLFLGPDEVPMNGRRDPGLRSRDAAYRRDAHRGLLEPWALRRRPRQARDLGSRRLELRGGDHRQPRLGGRHLVRDPDGRGRGGAPQRLLGEQAGARHRSRQDPQRPAGGRELQARGAGVAGPQPAGPRGALAAFGARGPEEVEMPVRKLQPDLHRTARAEHPRAGRDPATASALRGDPSRSSRARSRTSSSRSRTSRAR